MLTRLLVLAMQMFFLTFGMRYVGFTAEQTLVLSVSILSAIHIK